VQRFLFDFRVEDREGGIHLAEVFGDVRQYEGHVDTGELKLRIEGEFATPKEAISLRAIRKNELYESRLDLVRDPFGLAD
jgi:hypothetical protein